MVKKYIVPVRDLNTNNCRVVGISINKNGKIRHLKVRKTGNSEAPIVITLGRKHLHPLNETLDRLGV